MNDTVTTPRAKVTPKTKRPRLHKVILINDDYTPREFVVAVLCTIFRTSEDEAYNIMMNAKRVKDGYYKPTIYSYFAPKGLAFQK